jgi:hypothetical protein
MHCDSMAPFGGAVTCDTCAPFDPAGGVAMKLAHDVTLVQVSAMPPAGGRTTVLVAAPAAPHCRGGWYIADAEMRDTFGESFAPHAERNPCARPATRRALAGSRTEWRQQQ